MNSRWFFGAILVSVGVLMSAACGLCTLAFIAADIPNFQRHVYEAGLPSVIALLIGGTPTAIGVYLIWLGLREIKRSREGRPADDDGASG